MRKMHGVQKRVLGLFLCIALLLTAVPSTVFAVADNGSEETIGIRETDFLKADGKLLRKNYGTGEVTYLRGTNAGGYLLQEFWMCLTEYTNNVSCELELYNKLQERFGEKTMLELVDYYQDIYWTEKDFDNCAAMGMNCIRLPIWYRNLVDANGKFRSDAWDKIDWFIENAGERGMYVILDMHGAPGSQNGSDHSGVDGRDNKEGASKFFWGNDAGKNQNLFYTIWENIARRYKDNPIVAGYDLLNEPYCTYRYSSSHSDDELHNLLWGIYDKAYDKIRAIDKNHIIIMEATWDPWDLPDPSKFNWSNVMYEYHNYLYDDYDNAAGGQISNMKKKTDAIANANYNVPSYMGEFNYMNNPSAWDEGLKLLNDCGLNWTIWTYKTTSSSGNWGTFHHSSDNKVNIETDSVDTIKSKWAKAATASENTLLTNVVKKYLPGVNKTTQYVNLKNGDYYLTVNSKVVKAPDSGNSPLAAVSNSYTGNAEKFTVVNNDDGTISLKSGANGKYVCAVINENNQLLARSSAIDAWEKFYAVRINDSQIGLLSYANGLYVKGDFNSGQGSVLKAANNGIGGSWEAFTIKTTSGGSVDLGNGTSGGNTDAGVGKEGNVLANPTFENGTDGWTTFVDETSEATFKKDGNAGLDIDIKNPGSRDWSVQLFQENMTLTEGKKYEVTVDLVSTKERSIITALQNYNAAAQSAINYGTKTTKLEANVRTTIQFTTDTIRTNVTAGKIYIGLGQVSGSDPASKITVYSVNVVPMDGADVGEDKTYNKLVWADEFEGNKLNTDNWVFERGNGENGWGNGESQYYTDRSENLSVGDGMLKITARKENYEGFQYTSSRIKTQGKQSFKYGRIEAKIKMDEGQGHWPAFWMLGDGISSIGWPKCGEIDIMEWSSKWDYTVGTLHWADASQNHAFNTGYTYTSSLGNIDTSKWHTYAIEWDETAIRFLCDGVRYHYINIEGPDFQEFHENHFILLNVAVGGNFTGYNIDDSIFPRSMYVDYVRVYAEGEAETPPTEETETPPTTETETPPTEETESPPTGETETPPTGETETPPTRETETPPLPLETETPPTGESDTPSTEETEPQPTPAIKVGTTFSSGKYKYKVTKATAGVYTAELKGAVKKKIKTVKVPSTVKYQGLAFKVTSIGKKAFYNNKNLKKVTIGKNVTTIGSKAFYRCKNLKKVNIKSTKLNKIGKKAFRSIHKKAVIKLPVQKTKAYSKMVKKAK